METLQGKLGYRNKNSVEVLSQNQRNLIEQQRSMITSNYNEGLMSQEFYQKQMEMLDSYDKNATLDAIKKSREAMGFENKTQEEKANEWRDQQLQGIEEQRKALMSEKDKAYADIEKQESKQSVDNAINRLRDIQSIYDRTFADETYVKAKADQMTTFGSEYQDLRLRHQEEANRLQNENILHQQELNREQYQRQQQRRMTHSRLGYALYGLEDRRTSLREQVRGYEQNNVKLQHQQEEIEKKLTNIDLKDEERKALESQKTMNANTIATNVAAIKNANAEIEQLGSSGAKAEAVFTGLSSSVAMFAQRLGHQMFRKVMQETKQFIKQFDSSMNEIQAITLKSDNEMQDIRSQTISKAIGLRTSVSNVATTEAALYRQGLSDQEVSSRTDSIIKFATVTKLNVAEATKIITTALQNDLVGSAQQAMDALVALGDSAATTAAEIGKGMQKAAASAKVAGVSYSELTALLTIGTSDTQLSGTQVGTALQTVFTRMRRLTSSGYVADQNGTKTTANEAEAALQAVGVELWDDKRIGKMRTAYEVMSDLSKVWQNLSDAQKSIVTSALAGTRQTNVFSTLMEGMSEDGGATLDKYLGLAEDSEGITQSKYEIAMESLAASLDTLKSSWDGVVESFVQGGQITGVLDGLSGFLQSISNADDIGRGLAVIAAGITGIGVAILALESSSPALKAFSTILGVAAGLATGATILKISSLFNVESDEEREKRLRQEHLEANTKAKEIRNTSISEKESAVKKVEKYGEAFSKLKDAEDELVKFNAQQDLIKSLSDLANAFPDLNQPIEDSINNLDHWSEAIKKAKEEIDNLKEEDSKQSVKEDIGYIVEHGDKMYKEYYDKWVESHRTGLSSDQKKAIELGTDNVSGIAGNTLFSARLRQNEDFGGAIYDDENYRIALVEGLLRNGEDDVMTALADAMQYAGIQDALSVGSQIIANKGDKNADMRAGLLSREAKLQLADYLIGQFAQTDEVKLSENEMRQIGLGYFENSLIPSIDFSRYATDKYSGEYFKQAFINGFTSEIANKNSKYAFFKPNGEIDNDEIARYLEDLYSGSTEQKEENVEKELRPEDYAYHIGEKGFTSYDEAADYVKKNKLDYSVIKDSSGNEAYQNAKKAIKTAALTANQKQENQNLSKAIGLIAKSSSLSDLRTAYDKEGLGQELANVLSSNSELFGLYQMVERGQLDYEKFQKVAKELNVGRAGSKADITDAVLSAVQTGTLSVSELRTDKAYAGVYKTFQEVIGDAADEVLNAIADGVSNPEAMKSLSKNLVQQRIKEAMQFDQYYQEALDIVMTSMFGTDKEKMVAAGNQRSEMQGYYDYAAAVERYINGTAKEQDYATIAAYDNNFTETTLRNGVSSDLLRKNAQTFGQEKIDIQNKAIEEYLAGVGLTFDDLLKLDEYTTDYSKVLEYVRSKNKNEPGSVVRLKASKMISSGGITNRQYVEARNPGFSQGLSELQNNPYFIYDNNGIIIGVKPGNEQQLDKKAIDDQYKNQRKESDLASIYRTMGFFAQEGYSYDEIKDRILTDKEYEKLMQDEDFRIRAEAGIKGDEIFNLARRKASGQTASIYEDFDAAWWSMFQDYSGNRDISLDNVKNARRVFANSKGANRDYFSAFISRLPQALQDVLTKENVSDDEINEAIKAYNLDKAQYDTSTLSGMLNYETLRYEQANKKGLAGNRLVESLSGINPEGMESLEEFTNSVNSQSVDDWKAILEGNEEFANKLNGMGIKFDENGFNFDSIKEKGYQFADVLQMLIEAASQSSKDLQDLYITDQQKYEEALKYTGEPNAQGIYEGKAEYASIVGSVLASKKATVGLTDFEQAYESTMLENYKNGIIGLTDINKAEMQRQLYNAAVNGTYDQLVQPGTDRSIISAYTSGNSMLENTLQMSQAIAEYNNANKTSITLDQYAKNPDAYKDLTRYLEAAHIATDNVKEGLDDLDESLVKSERDAKNFGKATKSNTAQMDLFSKDAKKQGAALIQMNQALSKVAQNQYYRQQYRSGKRDNKTLQGVASLIQAPDAKAVKKMNEETVKKLLDASENVDKGTVQEYANTYAKQIESMINDQFKQGELVVDGVPVTVSSGPVNIDASGSIAEANAGLAQLIDQMNALFQGWGIDAKLQVQSDGEHFHAEIVTNDLGKGSGGGGGGGGGGGKSKADKLIEKQKREMAVYEHKNKMLEIQEKMLDYDNNYSGQLSNIDAQIASQSKTQSVYSRHIKELKNMMKTVKEGSDDYYKLRDALYAAEEAMKDITNTINELNSKRLEVLNQKIENQDKPLNHRIAMIQSYAERFMNEDRFKDYERYKNSEIRGVRTQRDTNEDQIQLLKKQLAKLKKNSDSWIETRDKIWEIEEENAELDNQLVELQLELNSQRLSQIAKIVQQNTQTATHNQNIASTYASAYESGGYRSQYESMIKEQIEANKTLISENSAAEKSARKQLSTLEEGSTAWFEAQAAMYQYSEAVAQAKVSQIELNRALAESNIEKVSEEYTDATRELSHVNELLDNQAKEYLETNDYEAYFAAMESYMNNLPAMIEAEQTALAELQAQYNKGIQDGTLDPAMQRQYLDEINNRESELQKLVLEQRQKQREIDKTRLDQIFNDQDFAQSKYDHNIKLIGYETSKYQNNGEYTNVNTMIQAENRLRRDRVNVLQDEIAELERQHDLFSDGSEQEKRIVEQIKKKEEALGQENAQLEKNNKLLEENEKKIMQVRKTLEDAVDKEIEAEKKRQREILAANVTMQNTVVELLKKRLQDEWNLKKKDIAKEKEALNEYKKLINERFNYRKKASQQADKDEELADYRRQLALIEADPSRSKDAKELRRKIEELEKDQAWNISEDEVNAENERIDDQITGMDKFVQYNEELLNEILGDANNFATEMNDILSGSFEESYNKILEFMQKENEAFMKSLPDAQKQMIQGWEDTWKKANDIVDSNYAEISEIIMDKDSYLDFMRETDRMYRSYAENGDQNSMNLLERQWSEYYDNYVNSIKTGASFDEHEHTLSDVVSKIDELKDNVFSVNIIGINGKTGKPYGLDDSDVTTEDFSTGEVLATDPYNLNNTYKKTTKKKKTTSSSNSSKKSTSTGNTNTYTRETTLSQTVHGKLITVTGHGESKISRGDAQNKADADAKAKLKKAVAAAQAEYDRLQEERVPPVSEWINTPNGVILNTPQYAKGGLVDYTGPAWVDGTKTNPEAFLDSTDTKLLRSMLNSFDIIKKSPYMSYIDPSMYGNTSNVGDINITINQAELNSDADIEDVAKRVGQAFSKELQRNGLNLSGYAFG